LARKEQIVKSLATNGTAPDKELAFLAELIRKLQSREISIYQLEHFLNDGKPFGFITNTNDEVLTVALDHERSLADVIREVSSDVEPALFRRLCLFPRIGVGLKRATVIIVHLSKPVSFDEALREIYSRGMQPAKLRHFLAVSKQHLDKLLGCRSFTLDPILETDAGKTIVNSYWTGVDLRFACNWDVRTQFEATAGILAIPQQENRRE
jgi:hypothetical protein